MSVTDAAEPLALALQHTVSVLNVLGGAIHLLEPHHSRLSLLAMAGLPPAFAEAWNRVPADQDLPQAVAVRSGCPVGPLDVSGAFGSSSPLPGAVGPLAPRVLVLPLGPRAAPVGTLSMLIEHGNAFDDARASLTEVAGLLGGHLAGLTQSEDRTTGNTRSGPGEAPGPMLDAAQVGTFDWDIRTGHFLADERSCRIYGVNPETFDSRVETWMQMVHPDDLPLISLPMVAFGSYDCEYRIIRPDGDTRWVRSNGLVLPGPDEQPGRAVGTLYDNTGSHATGDGNAYALKRPTDGVFVTDGDGRIIYVNVQAEGILRTSRSDLLGRILWTAVPHIGEPSLEARCREAAATGVRMEFDVHVQTVGTWYRFRINPHASGLTLSLSDITEARLRGAERVRVEHAAALRTNRTQQLTSALSEAVTVKDVVGAVGDHLLTPFGATGLAVQTLEGAACTRSAPPVTQRVSWPCSRNLR